MLLASYRVRAEARLGWRFIRPAARNLWNDALTRLVAQKVYISLGHWYLGVSLVFTWSLSSALHSFSQLVCVAIQSCAVQ